MSLVKKGLKAAMANAGKAGKFLTLQPGTPVDVVLMHDNDGIQSVDQHDWWDYTPAPHLVCLGLGDDCPSCALGNESKTKSYIGVVTREQEVKYLPAGASIVGQLEKYEKALGNLKGRLVQVEKTGVGLKTKYSVLMLGKKMDVSKFELPELEELLGDLTVEGQLAKLVEAGVDTSPLTKTSTKKAPAKKSAPKSTPAEVTEEPVTAAPWDSAEDDATAEGDSAWASL